MWRRKRKALSYSYLEAAQTDFQPEKSSWTISWWFIRSHKTLVFKNFISLFFWSFHYLVILSCAPLPCEYSLCLALTSNLEDIIFQAFCLGVLKPLPALARIDRTNSAADPHAQRLSWFRRATLWYSAFRIKSYWHHYSAQIRKSALESLLVVVRLHSCKLPEGLFVWCLRPRMHVNNWTCQAPFSEKTILLKRETTENIDTD